MNRLRSMYVRTAQKEQRRMKKINTFAIFVLFVCFYLQFTILAPYLRAGRGYVATKNGLDTRSFQIDMSLVVWRFYFWGEGGREGFGHIIIYFLMQVNPIWRIHTTF